MPIIHFSSLSRTGLSSEVIQRYQNSVKGQTYIDVYPFTYFPPILLYKGTTVIADGIHRICAQLYYGKLEFEYEEV